MKKKKITSLRIEPTTFSLLRKHFTICAIEDDLLVCNDLNRAYMLHLTTINTLNSLSV